MAESTTSTPPKASPASGPQLGEIVLVRSSQTQSVPAIVVNDYAGQNSPETLGLMVFLANPYEANTPLRLIPDAQMEKADSPLTSLANDFYKWWRPKGDKGRDIPAELIDQQIKNLEAQKTG